MDISETRFFYWNSLRSFIDNYAKQKFEIIEAHEALLFCLEEYLYTFYEAKHPYEKDIRELFIEYSNSDSISHNVEEAKLMIAEYMFDE